LEDDPKQYKWVSLFRMANQLSKFVKMPVIDLDTCVGTGNCVQNCSKKALKLVNGRAVLTNERLCADCRETECEFCCPTGAITVKYREV